jgi:hypothetical protein
MSPPPQRPLAASAPGGHRQRPGKAGSAAVARIGALVALVLAACMLPAHAQLFADDDARKAILDLRARLAASEEQARTRQAETNEQLQSLRRSLLDLNSQLEAMRSEMAKLRGSNEQLLRDVSELQRKQRDLGQAVDERLRKMEPQKVTCGRPRVQRRPRREAPVRRSHRAAALGRFRQGQPGLHRFPGALAGQRLRAVGALLARQRAVRQARLPRGHRRLPRLPGCVRRKASAPARPC